MIVNNLTIILECIYNIQYYPSVLRRVIQCTVFSVYFCTLYTVCYLEAFTYARLHCFHSRGKTRYTLSTYYRITFSLETNNT